MDNSSLDEWYMNEYTVNEQIDGKWIIGGWTVERSLGGLWMVNGGYVDSLD